MKHESLYHCYTTRDPSSLMLNGCISQNPPARYLCNNNITVHSPFPFHRQINILKKNSSKYPWQKLLNALFLRARAPIGIARLSPSLSLCVIKKFQIAITCYILLLLAP